MPAEFLKPAGSPRDPRQGEPATVFRYDLIWEFVSAIVEGRPAVPSFHDGLNAQMSPTPCSSRTRGEPGSTRRWRRCELSRPVGVQGREDLDTTSTHRILARHRPVGLTPEAGGYARPNHGLTRMVTRASRNGL